METNGTVDGYPNNLYEIRHQLGLTQKKFAQVIGITEKQYRNYELGDRPLPIKRAMLIAQKYNWSLDYIYKLTTKEQRTDQFMVDIRDIISYENGKILVKISDAYWKYLSKKEMIKNSNNPEQHKKNDILELDSSYISEDNNTFWKVVIEIEKEKFGAIFKCENDEIPYGIEDNNGKEIKVTDERVKEAQNFVAELLNMKENE